MMKMKRILVQTSLLAAAVVVVSACSSRSLTRAAVEDRKLGRGVRQIGAAQIAGEPGEIVGAVISLREGHPRTHGQERAQ